jgi:hypothetical protein
MALPFRDIHVARASLLLAETVTETGRIANFVMYAARDIPCLSGRRICS